MTLAKYVARMGMERSAFSILLGTQKERSRWEKYDVDGQIK
jgi:hypothetical protein